MGFKVDMSGAKDKISAICSNPKVGQFAAETTRRLVEPYVPRLEGVLRSSAVVSPWLITYTAPYAHYQWEGRNIGRRTTPMTVSHWEECAPVDEIAIDITEYLKGLQ